MKSMAFKGALALMIFACFLFGKNEAYTDVVKSLYIDESSSKVIGRLLPTNAVSIESVKNDRVKLTITGYVNPSVANGMYGSDAQRVIAASGSKTANIEFKILQKGKSGKWDKAQVVAYASKDNFTNELKPMLVKAEQIYNENCGICHVLPEPSHSKANQWPGLLQSMLSRTAIEKNDEWLVIQYLQKHSEDVKLKEIK